jgi:hypothetical protein
MLGPLDLPTEIIVSGRITYGYVWNRQGEPAGDYRITFSIRSDEDCNAAITADTMMVNEKANPTYLFYADVDSSGQPTATWRWRLLLYRARRDGRRRP